MHGTPLPPTTSDRVQAWAEHEPNVFSAYNTCLLFEKKLATPATAESVRLVRLLGYLLLCAPNRFVRSEVAKCIHSRNNQSDLIGIGAFLESHVIVAFKKFKEPTSIPTSGSSRSSCERTRSQMITEIKEGPENYTSAKQLALIRDNWRCIITGMLHIDTPADVVAACDPSIYHARFECAHIIPEATFFGAGPSETDNAKLVNSTSVLAILLQFHSDISNFNGPKVHALTNVMTLQKDLHDGFDRLELYFEATTVRNRYKVKTYRRYNLHQHEEVTFTTPDAEKLPLPSPELLALHATCCQVAHLCGSTEYIDRVYRDADEMGVLANDGTSADLLKYMLLPLVKSATAVRADSLIIPSSA